MSFRRIRLVSVLPIKCNKTLLMNFHWHLWSDRIGSDCRRRCRRSWWWWWLLFSLFAQFYFQPTFGSFSTLSLLFCLFFFLVTMMIVHFSCIRIDEDDNFLFKNSIKQTRKSYHPMNCVIFFFFSISSFKLLQYYVKYIILFVRWWFFLQVVFFLFLVFVWHI